MTNGGCAATNGGVEKRGRLCFFFFCEAGRREKKEKERETKTFSVPFQFPRVALLFFPPSPRWLATNGGAE